MTTDRAELVLDGMRAADAQEVLRIYAEGIATGNSTFEKEAPPWERWDAAHLPSPRVVARNAKAMMGAAGCAATS